ncbi:MAG: energy transducer TonB, partial [Planctomycetes bacterium]|nr:energy transducer TonB [Planctomycetota bacterium]
MKILTPISNPLDLILSAATAVAVHAVLLGYGAGFFLERSPAPIIQSVHEAECISMLPIKKAPREKVRTLQQEPEKVPQTNRDEILDRELSSKRIPQIPEHRSLAAPRDSAQKKRIEEPAKHREKVPQVVREKVLKPDETWLKENEAQSNSSVALSNHPSPVLDRGWKPLYPEKAKRNNWEGRVELMLTISPQGRVI